ncbi:MAG: hypothetical protein H7Z75_20500 [Ferruginibacter sp.]|nr:hypothetical protein [Cytophagales bacterium]
MDALLGFQKETTKPSIFTFRRSDGSAIWTKLNRLPIEHDLAHYAVEKTLQFKQAFYGLLDQGFTPEAFELPRDKRSQALMPANLPVEAHQAEFIVGLLQTERISGENSDFVSTLKQALDAKEIPFPNRLTEDQLRKIRETYRELVYQWNTLKSGERLELPFNP